MVQPTPVSSCFANTLQATVSLLRRHVRWMIFLAVTWAVLTYAISDVDTFAYVADRMRHLRVLVAVVLVGEVLFIGGLVLMAVALGQHLFAGVTPAEFFTAAGTALVLSGVTMTLFADWGAIIAHPWTELRPMATMVTIGAILMVAPLWIRPSGGAVRSPWQWAKTLGQLRSDRAQLMQHARISSLFRWGFNCNWAGAILGITGLPLLVAIIWVLPPAGWGLMLVPIFDILVSTSLRLALKPAS